jgi:hypothetical protein
MALQKSAIPWNHQHFGRPELCLLFSPHWAYCMLSGRNQGIAMYRPPELDNF